MKTSVVVMFMTEPNSFRFKKGKYYTYEGVIVLCTKDTEVPEGGCFEGVVVAFPDTRTPGEYSTKWNAAAFEPFEGAIAIQQTEE